MFQGRSLRFESDHAALVSHPGRPRLRRAPPLAGCARRLARSAPRRRLPRRCVCGCGRGARRFCASGSRSHARRQFPSAALSRLPLGAFVPPNGRGTNRVRAGRPRQRPSLRRVLHRVLGRARCAAAASVTADFSLRVNTSRVLQRADFSPLVAPIATAGPGPALWMNVFRVGRWLCLCVVRGGRVSSSPPCWR